MIVIWPYVPWFNTEVRSEKKGEKKGETKSEKNQTA
jgi:hypothetical protein